MFRTSIIKALKFQSKSISGLKYLSSVPVNGFLTEEVVNKRVLDVVKSIKSCPEQLNNDSLYVADLGFDSLIRKELYNKLSDEFCVNLAEKEKDSLISVETTTKYFSSHPKAR